MSSYAPPPGPPPPSVPSGWEAVWNTQYERFFFVNIYTKQSQWNQPTEPVSPSSHAPPAGPPPSYSGPGPAQGNEKGSLSSNNPYGPGSLGGGPASHDISEDERLARQLQAEEEARAAGRPASRGAADGYYNQPAYGQQQQSGTGYGTHELPLRQEKSKGGFLGKLLGKASGSGQTQSYGGAAGGAYNRPPQQQQQQQQQQYYGGASQSGYVGYPPQHTYYASNPPYVQQQQQQAKKHGGIGAGGAAALGLGGGLVGGMLLEDAIQDHDEHEYEQGYDQGYDQGQDGGDVGGGDDMGGDF